MSSEKNESVEQPSPPSERASFDHYIKPKNNRFMSLLSDTKKYRELYTTKEAGISFFLSSFTLLLLMIIYSGENWIDEIFYLDKLLSFLGTFLLTIIAGLFTLLGLSIASFALLTGSIDQKFLSIIEHDGKAYTFMSLIFNFYFTSFIIGISLTMSIFNFLLLNIPLDFSLVSFIGLTFINSYLVFFSIIYSIMLLGTSIRMLLFKFHKIKSQK